MNESDRRPRQVQAQITLLEQGLKDYAIVGLTPDGVVTSWDPSAERLFGWAEAEMLDQSFARIFTPEDRAAGVPEGELAQAVAEGRAEDERWHLRKGGERFWASGLTSPLHDDRGAHLGFMKVARDATIRKRVEEERDRLFAAEQEARAASERAALLLERLQAITDAALAHLTLDELLAELLGRICGLLEVDTAVVLLLDPGQDTLVVRAARGLEEEAARGVRIPLGRGFAGRVAAERRPVRVAEVDPGKLLNPVLRARGVRSLLGVPLLAGGRLLGVLHVGTLARRDFGKDDVRLLQLVADRAGMAVEHARLYESEREARRLAQEALAARDAFIGTITHDLKSPLAVIKGQTELAQRRLARGGLDADRLSRGLAGIAAGVDRMARMLQELLDLARLEGGGDLALDLVAVDIVALTRRVAAEHRRASARHALRVEADAPDLVGRYDAARLERVLDNLLGNAVKYSPDGGAITVVLTREEAEGRDWVRLAVRDQGVGIPARDLPRVFERFHRGSNVAGRIGGTGLGLAGAKQIVEQHGGTIAVESGEGRGTTVTVRLPLL